MARINWANPIARGLVVCCVPLAGAPTYIELVSGEIGVPTNMLAPKANPNGGGKSVAPYVIAPCGDGSTSARVRWTPSATLRGGSISSVFTVLALAGVNGGNSSFPIIGMNGDPVGTAAGIGLGIDLGYYVGYGGIRGLTTGAGASTVGSASNILGSPSKGQLHCFGYSSDGATVTWMHAGTTSTTAFAYSEPVNTNRQLSMNGPPGAAAGSSNSTAFAGWFCIWDRVLSPAEYATIYANPWQLFVPEDNTLVAFLNTLSSEELLAYYNGNFFLFF